MALSRIAVVILGVTVASPVFADSQDDLLARYAAKTSVVTHCTKPSGDTILVCGRRAADKWRVPYLSYEPGDPRGESLPSERERIQAKNSNPCQNRSAFLIGCGAVGVSSKVSFGASGISAPRLRPLAD